MTGWGFLGVRLPLPEDPQWKADQTTILKALGVLDPSGKPTTLPRGGEGRPRWRASRSEEWQAQRDRMIDDLQGSATRRASRGRSWSAATRSIREADRLMAEAIEIVAGLYRDGLLQRSKEQRFDYPNVLQFHDSRTRHRAPALRRCSWSTA